MIHPDSPVADRFGAAVARPKAIVAMDRLRDALCALDVHASISYTGREPRLHVKNDLTVWADAEAGTFFWSARAGEPAENAPAADPARAAECIAQLLARLPTAPRDK